jgi:hypothetical protein
VSICFYVNASFFQQISKPIEILKGEITMPVINTERVINSNDKKKLIVAYNNLRDDYKKVNAYDYYSLYESKDLSFILENSNYIFTEPYKGYGFYKNIIESEILPLDSYDIELGKIDSYLEQHSDEMSSTQREMYNTLYETVANKRSELSNSISLHTEMSGETSCLSDMLYDTIYASRHNLITESLAEAKVEAVLNENCEFMDIFNCLSREPKYSTQLNLYIESCYAEDSINPSDIKQNSTLKHIISRMMRDNIIEESVRNTRNSNLRYNIMGISQVNDNDVIKDLTTEVVTDFNPIFSSMYEAVEKVYRDDYVYEFYKDEYSHERSCREKSVVGLYENAYEFMLYDMLSEGADPLTTSTRDSLVASVVNEAVGLNSTPNMQEQLFILENKLDDIYTTEGGESSAVLSKLMGDDVADDNFGNTKNKNKSKSTADITDDEDENDDQDNSDDDTDGVIDEHPQKSKGRVNKGSQRPVQKIESKIVDVNKNIDKATAAGKDAANHAKAIGRGVTKVPRDIDGKVKQMLNDYDTMDMNKRKEFMLRPGVRKKYMKNLELLILYGTSISISPLATVCVAMCRHASKTKNKRACEELMRDLQSELKVIKMKKEDAKMAGDLKQSYELQRIEDQFKYQLKRVATNYKSAV